MHPGDGENAGQRAEVDELLDMETARAGSRIDATPQ